MTNSLIRRLRTAKNTTLGVGALWNLCDEAADEIERLRLWNQQMVEKAASGGVLDGYRELGARAASLEAEIKSLRGALEAIAQTPASARPGNTVITIRRIAFEALKGGRND